MMAELNSGPIGKILVEDNPLLKVSVAPVKDKLSMLSEKVTTIWERDDTEMEDIFGAITSGELSKTELEIPGVPPDASLEAVQLLEPLQGKVGFFNSKDQPPSSFTASLYQSSRKLTLSIRFPELSLMMTSSPVLFNEGKEETPITFPKAENKAVSETGQMMTKSPCIII